MKCPKCGTYMEGPRELSHGLPGTKYWECPSCGNTKPVTRRQGKERLNNPPKKWDVGEQVQFRRGSRMTLPAHRHLNNPPLMTFMANPPSARMQMRGNLVPYTGIRYFKNDPISRECHAILYTHAENGEDFKHEFGPDVKLYPAVTAAGKHVVIIEGDDDIWDDYPE